MADGIRIPFLNLSGSEYFQNTFFQVKLFNFIVVEACSIGIIKAGSGLSNDNDLKNCKNQSFVFSWP